MDKTYILAIDNGTQSVRALLFDLHGNLVDKSQVGIDSYRSPEPGWVENDADAFWHSLCTACQRLWANTRVPKDAIAGAVITAQRGTLVPLDAKGQPLRPFIVWMDQRVDAGEPLPDMPSWVARENKWRAARYGLDGRVMLDTTGRTQPFRENIAEIVEMLSPVATQLGTLDALQSVREILDTGSSANRQRAVVAHGGSLNDVVDLLREELAADLR